MRLLGWVSETWKRTLGALTIMFAGFLAEVALMMELLVGFPV